MTKSLKLALAASALSCVAANANVRPAAVLQPSTRGLPRAIVGQGVRADVSDPKAMFASLQTAFEEFKAANEQKLSGKADVLVDQKVEKINEAVGAFQGALDEINTRMAALQLSGGGAPGQTREQRTYSETFAKFFRRGDEGATSALHDLAVKAAMTSQSDPDGGFLVPTEMEQAIDRVLGTTSIMRTLAQIQPIGSSEYKKQVSLGGAGSGWVGETDARPETGTPVLGELTFTPGEIYAKPKASQTLLDDSRVDLAAWLAGEVDIEFSEKEGAAFITGNGIKKPRGILDYDKVADAAYEWGKLGYVKSGHATLLTGDALINLVYAPKTGYRPNARFLMNRKTVGAARLLKDGQGNYLWQPSAQAGQPATLSGYTVAEDDNMPDVGAGAYPVAFGDFRRGYLIVDRMGIRVLRDPYSSKPFVEFYTTKRVGGGVQDFAAIKLMQIAA
ncbi:phage major capsid protein [Caulobacter sp.]|uniref:phage major capsid protein n=1 Tax=Caulobacter sp. TaxID=78 RepID=UPI003BB16EA1